ncbi:unnamed protein product [Cuscuta campestris]|uniref:Uncharacterized protein n=1 Tax=Cuscuta campestris TaxID=132261 RepID=A0A484KZP8_9ASTE|nr:unnamed protein product [Cuscuta campestris]
MSSHSDRVSSSEDCSSEDSNSSSSTGSSSLDSTPGQVPNSIPDPHPVNQVPGETFMGRDDPVDDEPGPYDPEHETRDAWEERLHAAVLPGGSGCEGFVFFKARTGRKFISEVPQSNRGWKEKFVFIEFPPFFTPLAGLKWNDHLLDQEYAAPASSPDLEANLEILMRGDPQTGRIFHQGSWVWRVESGGEGTSQAQEAAGHGVPSPGNTTEAEGQNHPDMEFEEFAIPDDQPAGETGGSQANPARTFPVNLETVEILDEDELQDNRSKGKEKEKAGRRVKKVATTHPSYAKKRARSDPEPAGQTIEEAFINLGLRLNEAGEIGPHTVDRLGMSSPSEVDRLKREKEEMALILRSQADELIRLSGLAGAMKTEISQLKEENGRLLDEVSEAKREKEEMALILRSQADELIRLSGLAGAMKTEISQLKEENGRLLDEVSEAKREVAEKEETFPGRAAAWVEKNKAEAARVMTATPETTMESFRLLYREPEGKKMITAIGSFGFKSGQKKDRIASHRVLLRRDPNFSAASYGLAPIPEEEPTPPFPLD